MFYAEPVHRCTACGELRGDFNVRFNRGMGNSTDRCPYCEELLPGTQKTLRLVFRYGLPDPNETPDREPDLEIGDAEMYVTQTRGEASAEVEREEWNDEG